VRHTTHPHRLLRRGFGNSTPWRSEPDSVSARPSRLINRAPESRLSRGHSHRAGRANRLTPDTRSKHNFHENAAHNLEVKMEIFPVGGPANPDWTWTP
jgi:hypothetical protein